MHWKVPTKFPCDCAHWKRACGSGMRRGDMTWPQLRFWTEFQRTTKRGALKSGTLHLDGATCTPLASRPAEYHWQRLNTETSLAETTASTRSRAILKSEQVMTAIGQSSLSIRSLWPLVVRMRRGRVQLASYRT